MRIKILISAQPDWELYFPTGNTEVVKKRQVKNETDDKTVLVEARNWLIS